MELQGILVGASFDCTQEEKFSWRGFGCDARLGLKLFYNLT